MTRADGRARRIARGRRRLAVVGVGVPRLARRRGRSRSAVRARARSSSRSNWLRASSGGSGRLCSTGDARGDTTRGGSGVDGGGVEARSGARAVWAWTSLAGATDDLGPRDDHARPRTVAVADIGASTGGERRLTSTARAGPRARAGAGGHGRSSRPGRARRRGPVLARRPAPPHRTLRGPLAPGGVRCSGCWRCVGALAWPEPASGKPGQNAAPDGPDAPVRAAARDGPRGAPRGGPPHGRSGGARSGGRRARAHAAAARSGAAAGSGRAGVGGSGAPLAARRRLRRTLGARRRRGGLGLRLDRGHDVWLDVRLAA